MPSHSDRNNQKDSRNSTTNYHDLPTQLNARAWTKTRPQGTPPSVHAWTEIRPQDAPMTNHHTQPSIHAWTKVGTQGRNSRFSQPLTGRCHSHIAVPGYSLFAGIFPRSNQSLFHHPPKDPQIFLRQNLPPKFSRFQKIIETLTSLSQTTYPYGPLCIYLSTRRTPPFDVAHFVFHHGNIPPISEPATTRTFFRS